MPSSRNLLAAALLAGSMMPAAACGAAEPKAAPVAVETEDQKTLYAMGQFFAQNLARLNLTPEELAVVQLGLSDGALSKPAMIKLEEYGPKMQAFAQGRLAAAAAIEQKAGAEFLAAEAKKPGAVKTDSGLVYSEVTPGTGASPKPTDQVTVNYHGTLRDGTVFDSSVERGQPATFQLDGVIACWTEGVQKMKVGGKSRLVCPAAIAYGDRSPSPKIAPGSTLVFDVELVAIAPPAPAAPKQ
jgi:FKBP-type peptidyl-prolyl cis-trans isomerase